MANAKRLPKSGTKIKKRGSSKKRKSGEGGGGASLGGGESSGGGGVLSSLRGGFQKAGQAVAGTGPKKQPSKNAKILNYVLTGALVVALAYLVWKKFLQGG